MQLDQNIITQLQGLFANLKHQYTLVVDNAGDAKSEELATMARDFASTSPQISVEVRPADVLRLSASSVMGRLQVSPSVLSLAVTSSPPSSSPSSMLTVRAITSPKRSSSAVSRR